MDNKRRTYGLHTMPSSQPSPTQTSNKLWHKSHRNLINPEGKYDKSMLGIHKIAHISTQNIYKL